VAAKRVAATFVALVADLPENPASRHPPSRAKSGLCEAVPRDRGPYCNTVACKIGFAPFAKTKIVSTDRLIYFWLTPYLLCHPMYSAVYGIIFSDSFQLPDILNRGWVAGLATRDFIWAVKGLSSREELKVINEVIGRLILGIAAVHLMLCNYLSVTPTCPNPKRVHICNFEAYHRMPPSSPSRIRCHKSGGKRQCVVVFNCIGCWIAHFLSACSWYYRMVTQDP
jgi:hypothetical protein